MSRPGRTQRFCVVPAPGWEAQQKQRRRLDVSRMAERYGPDHPFVAAAKRGDLRLGFEPVQQVKK